jgi:hypothetical protein
VSDADEPTPSVAGLGAPETYCAESVLLTSLAAAARRLSFERSTEWLARYDALAEVLGYHQFDTFRATCALIARKLR